APVRCPDPGGARGERRALDGVGAWRAGGLLSRDHAGVVSPAEPHCPAARPLGAVRQGMRDSTRARAHWPSASPSGRTPWPPRANVPPVVTRCSLEGYAPVVQESPEQQADIARDAGSVPTIHDDTVQPP